MNNKLSLVLIVLATTVFAISYSVKSRDRNTKPYRVVCYYAAWSNYRGSTGKFTPDDMNIQACTHIIYAFSVLKDNRIVSHDPWQDLGNNNDWSGLGHYKKFNELRRYNSQLTTLIALGGWNEGNITYDHKYSKMVADPVKRNIFVNSVVEFLKEHDFDGLDFDWEYPGLRDGIYRPQDKANFVVLLKELSEAFKPYGFLLTAAVAAGKATIEAGYDIPQVTKYLDFISIMTYDFHGAFDNYTGHSSPLFARSDQIDDDKYKNVDYAIRHWISDGADRKKLILGIPLYGRCHTLEDSTKTGYAAPSAGNGTKGYLTQQEGMLGYNEVCTKLKQESGWTTVWNDCHLAPYMYREDQWCSYDDEPSVRIKVDYAKAMGLGGAMIWSIDTDDFHGHCDGRKFPLLTVISNVLEDTKIPPMPKPSARCKGAPSPNPTTTTIRKPDPTTTTVRKPDPTTTTVRKPNPTTTTVRKPTPTAPPTTTTIRSPPIEHQKQHGRIFSKHVIVDTWFLDADLES